MVFDLPRDIHIPQSSQSLNLCAEAGWALCPPRGPMPMHLWADDSPCRVLPLFSPIAGGIATFAGRAELPQLIPVQTPLILVSSCMLVMPPAVSSALNNSTNLSLSRAIDAHPLWSRTSIPIAISLDPTCTFFSSASRNPHDILRGSFPGLTPPQWFLDQSLFP